MFLEAATLGIIIGLFRKGRLSNLGDMQFRGLWLLVAASLIQISPLFLARMGILQDQLLYLPFVAMCLIVIVLFMNLEKSGIWFIIPGAISNMAVILANAFRMPVSYSSLEYSGLKGVLETIQDGSVINYINIENAESATRYLGKLIPLPAQYPLAKVLSAGDILITVGIVLLIQGEMKKVYYRHSGSMLKYSYKSKY